MMVLVIVLTVALFILIAVVIVKLNSEKARGTNTIPPQAI